MSKKIAGVRYWKISPWGNRWTREDHHGRIWEEQWNECLNEGKIWIGWHETGNLSDIPLEEPAGFKEIKKRLLHAKLGHEPHGLGIVARQIWRFRTIQPGDVVVANKGQFEIAGIGVVTGEYSYEKQKHFPHGLKVDWRDTSRKRIRQQNHWRLTVQELDAQELSKLRADSQRGLNRIIRLAEATQEQHRVTEHRQREKAKGENLQRILRTSAKINKRDEDLGDLLRDVPDDHKLSHKQSRVLVSRAQRNARIAKKLKYHYDGRCQMCRRTFRKKDGENYAEVHHLASNDHPKNLIVLCATCHRMLHYAHVQPFRANPQKRFQYVTINGKTCRIRYSSGHAKFFQRGIR